MKTSPRSIRFSIYLIIGTLWLVSSTSLFASQYEENVSSSEYSFLKGKVLAVSLAHQYIILKQKKGPNVTVFITPTTEFGGMKKLEELQVEQILKLWYRPGQNGNDALKIVRVPDLGC